MSKRRYKVLIPTSGVGTPLGDVTKYTNKSLIKIGKKPTLSYIIEAYPKNTAYVITLGHFGEHIREFVQLAYPDRDITFVPVDKYDGPGASLGYSMLKAKRFLQSPFIYHAGDTIVSGKIPFPHKNWVGGFKAEGSSSYASFDVFGGTVQHIHDKGVTNPDYLHIGLVGIHDYQQFWQTLQKLYRATPNDSQLGDVYVINQMIAAHTTFKSHRVLTWHDVGNIEGLSRVRTTIADAFPILDKQTESIFLFSDFVIKFFTEPTMVKERVRRAHHLAPLVPRIEGANAHFYRYAHVTGDLYADVANPRDFQRFLQWAKLHLWRPAREVSDKKFKAICRTFYETKTRERVAEFLRTRHIIDRVDRINGEKVPTVDDLFSRIDFDWLCISQQSTFHGDLVLDNILKTHDGYSLLDWRQNFGGLLKAGDRYYDFAKLNHNLTVNHGVVHDNLFTIDIAGRHVTCDILRPHTLVRCQQELFEFLREGRYDDKKVKVLTGLIWLNMSPLHHHPFDLFLFYFGKLHLWHALQDNA